MMEVKRYSLLCKWFRAAVLPLDAGLLYYDRMKPCAICGDYYVPKSNWAKYCPACAESIKRMKATERKRKQRLNCHALGVKKSF